MAEITGEGYISNRVNAAGTYYMFLVIDGQKVRKTTGTKDEGEAMAKLAEWKAQVKVGVIQGRNGLRYEDIRDAYLENRRPNNKDTGILGDLNVFFKGMKVSAIGGRLQAFRNWREKMNRVVESKQDTIRKEIALRTTLAKNGRKKELAATEIAKIEADAIEWVERGVKATTNKRLGMLRAMFHFAFKTGKITKADIPYFPMADADNVRQNKYSEQDYQNILKELPAYLHPLVKFLHKTGMRSGQAKAITWDMIDDKQVLTMPGFLTKNKTPYSLPLTDRSGKAYPEFAFLVGQRNRPHGVPVFDITNLRGEWRKACHKLGLGIFDNKTQEYRGANLHDFRRTAVSNMNAKGKSRGAAMSVTGHRTDSMYSRYGIEDLDTKRDALDA